MAQKEVNSLVLIFAAQKLVTFTFCSPIRPSHRDAPVGRQTGRYFPHGNMLLIG